VPSFSLLHRSDTVTAINPYLGIPMTAEQYAAQWQENSKFFSQGGHYDWMAAYLEQPSTVIEIGCGSGGSTLALAKRAQRVIAIEVNATLANAAAAYLNNNGVSTQVVEIETLGASLPASNHRVTILVSDVFSDRITEVLPTEEADAIACWLIGANPGLIATHIGKNIESFTGPEMPEYRERVHRRSYELGLSLLRPGGIIHITDRIALNYWSDKDVARLTLVKDHVGLSEGKYQISKASTFLKRIEKSFATSRIQYIVQPDVNDSAVAVLSSITGKKA
jgi:predicted O-methyltransferase YrrM